MATFLSDAWWKQTFWTLRKAEWRCWRGSFTATGSWKKAHLWRDAVCCFCSGHWTRSWSDLEAGSHGGNHRCFGRCIASCFSVFPSSQCWLRIRAENHIWRKYVMIILIIFIQPKMKPRYLGWLPPPWLPIALRQSLFYATEGLRQDGCFRWCGASLQGHGGSRDRERPLPLDEEGYPLVIEHSSLKFNIAIEKGPFLSTIYR